MGTTQKYLSRLQLKSLPILKEFAFRRTWILVAITTIHVPIHITAKLKIPEIKQPSDTKGQILHLETLNVKKSHQTFHNHTFEHLIKKHLTAYIYQHITYAPRARPMLTQLLVVLYERHKTVTNKLLHSYSLALKRQHYAILSLWPRIPSRILYIVRTRFLINFKNTYSYHWRWLNTPPTQLSIIDSMST